MSQAAGHRRFAALWDFQSRHESARERRYRAQVAGGVHGRTLEVGYGVGSNWPYLPANVEYAGIEPDPYMRERAIAHRPAGRELDLGDGDAQHLAFADASFDSVLGTLVFCTVPDASLALRESLRVLRPGGELHFLEHVRARNGVASTLQDFVTPLWRRLGAGCHPNRDTLALIRAAGFEVTRLERMKIGPLPAIVGVATKPVPAPGQV